MTEQILQEAIQAVETKTLSTVYDYLSRAHSVKLSALFAFLKDKILAAIDDEFRTAHRINEFCGLPRGFDLSPVFAEMTTGRTIRQPAGFTIDGYFRYEQNPLRVWLSGDGRVKAEFQKDYQPPKILDISADPQTRSRELFNGSLLKTKRGNMAGKKKIEITPEQVKEAAAGVGNQAKTAAALAIGFSTLALKLKQYPELKIAFFEGKQIFDQNNPDRRTGQPAQNKKEIAESVESAKVETVGAAVVPVASGSDDLPGATGGAVVAAGKIEVDPRFEHTLAQISENGHSRQAIEAVKSALLPERQRFFTEPDFSNDIGGRVSLSSFKRIEFADGHALSLELDADIFALDQPARVLVMRITDLLQAYEAAQENFAENREITGEPFQL